MTALEDNSTKHFHTEESGTDRSSSQTNGLMKIAISPFPENFLRYIEENISTSEVEVSQYIKQLLDFIVGCGCDTFMLTGTYKQADAILKVLHENGIPLNVFLSFSYLNDSPEHILQVLQHYGAIPYIDSEKVTYSDFQYADRIIGWQIMDQPTCSDWGQVYSEIASYDADGKYDNVAMNRLIMGYSLVSTLGTRLKNGAAVSDLAVIFNLAAIPDLADRTDPKMQDNVMIWTGASKTYREYVDVMDMMFKPKVWSYDFYPFTKSGDSSPIVVKSKEFFHYLSVFGNKVAQLNIQKSKDNPQENANPVTRFWAYGMVTEHSCRNIQTGELLWVQPAPTLGMLRYEAFNALAYGAKGFAYWRLGLSVTQSNGDETVYYNNAPIQCEITGNNSTPVFKLNPTWDNIRKVNEEIKELEQVFIGTSVKKCLHYPTWISHNEPYEGVPCVPNPSPDIDDPFKHFGTESAGIVVSRLQKTTTAGTQNYLLIVNKDYQNPQKISVTYIDVEQELIKYMAVDEPSVSYSQSVATLRLSLEAGGVMVFKWNVKNAIQPNKDNNDHIVVGIQETEYAIGGLS